MKLKFFLFVILILAFKVNSAKDSHFTLTFHLNGAAQLNKVIELQDGNYLGIGSIGKLNTDSSKILMVKFNSLGDTLWTSIINEKYNVYALDIAELVDSSFIICGYIDSNKNGNIDAFLLNTSPSGVKIKSKSFDGNGTNDYFEKLLVNGNSLLVIGAYGYDNENSVSDIWLVKFNSNLDSLNSKKYKLKKENDGYILKKSKDNGLIFGGYSFFRACLFKLDSNFNTVFGNTYLEDSSYPSNKLYSFGSIDFFERNDKNLILHFAAKPMLFPGKSTERFGFMAIDSTGNLDKVKYFGDTTDIKRHDRGSSILNFNDNEFVMSGTYNFFYNFIDGKYPDGDFYLIKTNTNGDLIYQRKYGDSNYQEMKNAILTKNKDILMVGYTFDKINTKDIYIVRTDSNGLAGIKTEVKSIANNKANLSIYPNPNNGKFKIEFNQENSNNLNSILQIFDITGKLIFTKTLSNEKSILLDISENSNGIYLFQFIHNDGKIETGKFIVN